MVASPVYVGLGASDTVGVGAARPEVEGWVPRVHAGLPSGTRLLNLGVSGAQLDDVLREQVPPAVDARPRWVTVWAGVNDLRGGVALDTYARQLDAVLEPFGAPHSGAPGRRPIVVLLNIPDLRRLPVFASANPATLDRTVRAWNDVIAAAALRHGAILVDLYAYGAELAEHPEYISADGFHPSSAGYERIAEIVLQSLQMHVSPPAP